MEFSEIVGKTLLSLELGGYRIIFHFADGTACESVHLPDCCESVDVHHIEGDLVTLLRCPILEATWDEDDKTGQPENDYDHSTWTRQRIRTSAGEVTFVWLGTSNGYYGETPHFQITHGKKI